MSGFYVVFVFGLALGSLGQLWVSRETFKFWRARLRGSGLGFLGLGFIRFPKGSMYPYSIYLGLKVPIYPFKA